MPCQSPHKHRAYLSQPDLLPINRIGSLAAVLAKVGKKPATIELIGTGEYKLKTGLTVPKNVTLRFNRDEAPAWIAIPEKLKANSTNTTVLTSFGK